jgi:acyl dehydratase
MSIDPRFVGKKYGPFRYQIGLEKMREFAYAVGGGVPASGFASAPEGLDPLFYDESAAKAGPHGSVIAFPTFAVTFAIAPFAAAVSDPELGINLLMLVHGEQEFEFFDVMRAGDVITTTGAIAQIYEKSQKDFLIVVSESKNQHQKPLVRGTWTAVIRR